jgi:hypothetical protein
LGFFTTIDSIFFCFSYFQYSPKEGDRITVTKSFLSDSKPQVELQKGLLLVVKSVHESGDITVNDEKWNKNKWIKSKHFGYIEKLDKVLSI